MFYKGDLLITKMDKKFWNLPFTFIIKNKFNYTY